MLTPGLVYVNRANMHLHPFPPACLLAGRNEGLARLLAEQGPVPGGKTAGIAGAAPSRGRVADPAGRFPPGQQIAPDGMQPRASNIALRAVMEDLLE